MNGAKLTLENDKLQVIIIELNGSGSRYGFIDDELDNLLKEYGFKPFTYNPFKRELISLDKYTNQNTIYLRNPFEVSMKLEKGKSYVLMTWKKIPTNGSPNKSHGVSFRIQAICSNPQRKRDDMDPTRMEMLTKIPNLVIR